MAMVKINDWCPACQLSRKARRLVTIVDYSEGQYYCSDFISVRTHPIPVTMGVFEVEEPTGDRFPHKCQRCGGKCYVGLNVVEHPPGSACR